MLARVTRNSSKGASLVACRSLFTLPKLAYPVEEGLLPAINARGLDLHYNKHHQTYVNNANKLVTGTVYENAPLVQVIKDTVGEKKNAVLFNNTAQIWNHSFFWECLCPNSQQAMPSEKFVELLDLHFGGLEKFKEKFSHNAVSVFGSGWTWLVDNDGQLEIVNTFNAGTALTERPVVTPLLTIDVWEHAYYPTVENRRADFVKSFWSNVDWAALEARYFAIKRRTFD